MKRYVALAFVVLLWIACIPSPPLAPHPQQFVGFGNETSVAFSLGSTPNKIITPGRTVVFYNGGFVWNTTTSGTFVPSAACNATTPGFPCFVPMAPKQTTWNSDPFVVSDDVAHPGLGIVAVSLLAGDARAGDSMVTVSVSNDQGRSFKATTQANSEGCSDGHMDQPAVAFDPLAPTPRIWAVWRYQAQATYGICVRGDVDMIRLRRHSKAHESAVGECHGEEEVHRGIQSGRHPTCA